LHSGEAPFEGVVAASWEGRYWHTAEIILEAGDSSIEAWLGADKAKAPKALLAEYSHATKEAAKIRVETAASAFAARPKKEREEAHALAVAAVDRNAEEIPGQRKSHNLSAAIRQQLVKAHHTFEPPMLRFTLCR
jgi:hypothetical protein